MAARNSSFVSLFLFLYLCSGSVVCKKSCISDEVILNCTLCELSDIPEVWNSSYITADLSRNNLSTITQFPFSPSIERIILQRNNISEIETRAFVQLTNLKSIDLSYNLLTYTSLSPLIFQGNDNINDYEPIYVEILKISHNVIHALGSKVFEHLPNLTELYLDHNPLGTLDPVTILAITNARRNLRILDISFCGLETIPEGFLHSLDKLKTIILDGNQFVTVPATLSEISGSLLHLSISDNPFYNMTFPDMEMLQELNISYVDTIGFIPSGSFANLLSLKALRLNNNAELRFIQENIFSKTQNVLKLELRGNALQTLPENLGVRWVDLEVLDLRDNPWHCDCSLAWFANSVVPTILLKHSQHIRDIKCASPPIVMGVPLIQMPLQACRSVLSITKRITTMFAFILLLVLVTSVMLGGRWLRRVRHPPLSRSIISDPDADEDIVHYVRIINSRD